MDNGKMTENKPLQTKPPTQVVSLATRNFFEKYGEAATQRNIVGRLLKFNKFGEFRVGQEEEEIKRGTALVAYMPSLAVGYVRWEDGKPAEIIMGPVGEGFVPPPRSELGYLDQIKWDTFDDGRPRDPWQRTNSVILVDLENEELLTFYTSPQRRSQCDRRTGQGARQAHRPQAGRGANHRTRRRLLSAQKPQLR
jgi:hypothetical protein